MEIDLMPMPDFPEQGLAPEGVTFDEVVGVIGEWCDEFARQILPDPQRELHDLVEKELLNPADIVGGEPC